MMMRAWVLSLLLYLPSSFAVFSAQLKNITVSQQPTMTSLYLSIQGSFTHKLFTLSQPNRVVL
ncbi:TPA: N-acetylmuramoyl-L-alanine amidase, partial [Legionella pneumophila subsp. pneumophila]|nr:N-acetylmuramoyl-L-alanine amidase [Legionella pneumophila subsp. pneumophila]